MLGAILAATLFLTSETPISTPSLIPAPRVGTFEGAANGRTMLAAWMEMRDGSQWDIAVARLDANGVPLDPRPTLLAITPEYDVNPQVVWTGSTFLVAWSAQTAVPPSASAVWIAEIDERGVVVR